MFDLPTIARGIAYLSPTLACVDTSAGAVSGAAKTNCLSATFVIHVVSSAPWTVRCDSGAPRSQADIDAKLAAPS